MPGPPDTRCASYTFGQCTFGACRWAGWVPEGLGNANQWWERAGARGYARTQVPTVGALAIFQDERRYNAAFGHCGVVIAVASFTRFQVEEMNFASWNVYDARWTDRVGLLGFIRQPGTVEGSGMAGPPAPLPPAHDLESAWGNLAAFWNYVVDAEVVGLHDLTVALKGIT